MKTLKQLFPPYLLIMILFVQVLSLLLNYDLYDTREIAIYLCWIPILMLPFYFSKNKIIYKIAVTLFFIDGFINLAHFLILKGPVSASSLFILSNTNINEAKEFLQLKFSFSFLLLIPYIILFFFAVRQVPPVLRSPKSKWIVMAVLLFSTIFILENLVNGRLIRKGVPQTIKALVSFVEEFKSYNALKKRKVEKIEAAFNTDISQKRVFVLIIGESCNRNHMSLYDYHRKTSPKLESRNDIIVYDNIISAYSSTLNSVLSLLTEANLENKMGFDKSISLIDVMHSAGFKTFWISNQSPIGVWDNAIYNLAQTSDVVNFVNNTGNSSFESINLAAYDEKLLEPFSSILNGVSNNKFIVIHLMGSHSAYAKRYPAPFNYFTGANSKKEQIINEYDNSILYNDFIVDSILNILKAYTLKEDNLISSAIYLSDHSENVYDENDNVGHDYSGSLPKSNVEIPFIVWLSNGYKQIYSNKQETIWSHKHKPFVIDDLFHGVLDLNDINCKQFKNTRSVFDKNFNANRPRILEDNMDYDLK